MKKKGGLFSSDWGKKLKEKIEEKKMKAKEGKSKDKKPKKDS